MVKKLKPEEKQEYIRIIILFILGFICSIFVISYLDVDNFVKEIFFMLFMLAFAFIILFLIRNRIRLNLSWGLSGVFFLLMVFNLIFMRLNITRSLFVNNAMDLIFNIAWILILEIGVFVSFVNVYKIYDKKNKKRPKKNTKRKVAKVKATKKTVQKKTVKQSVKKHSKKATGKTANKKVIKTKGIRKVVRKSIRKAPKKAEAPKLKRAS